MPRRTSPKRGSRPSSNKKRNRSRPLKKASSKRRIRYRATTQTPTTPNTAPLGNRTKSPLEKPKGEPLIVKFGRSKDSYDVRFTLQKTILPILRVDRDIAGLLVRKLFLELKRQKFTTDGMDREFRWEILFRKFCKDYGDKIDVQVRVAIDNTLNGSVNDKELLKAAFDVEDFEFLGETELDGISYKTYKLNKIKLLSEEYILGGGSIPFNLPSEDSLEREMSSLSIAGPSGSGAGPSGGHYSS